MLDRARGTAEKALRSLDACVDRVSEMLADPEAVYDQRLASHLSYLTKHAVMTLAELRKLEAHDQRAVKAMTPEQRDAAVCDYAREMARDGRARLRQVLDELDAEQLLA